MLVRSISCAFIPKFKFTREANSQQGLYKIYYYLNFYFATGSVCVSKNTFINRQWNWPKSFYPPFWWPFANRNCTNRSHQLVEERMATESVEVALPEMNTIRTNLWWRPKHSTNIWTHNRKVNNSSNSIGFWLQKRCFAWRMRVKCTSCSCALNDLTIAPQQLVDAKNKFPILVGI